MNSLKKPRKLNIGDTVATISLSGGAAGETDLLPWYNVAKKRLMNDFGLNVIETKNSLKGRKYIYENPKARAHDLMEALVNPNIKAIFLNQGGDDGIRLLPYIDYNILRNNPKIFLGFSDATNFHFMFYKAGVTSFYGANVLTTLAEPVKLHQYTEKWLKKVLFQSSPIGKVEASDILAYEPMDWINGIHRERNTIKNNGYEFLQGTGIVKGSLIGGALGPIVYNIKGTELFPSKEEWTNKIVFLDCIIPYGGNLSLIHMLRGLIATNIFKNVNAVILSGATNISNSESEKETYLKVFHEVGLMDLPILYNFNCGHISPMNVLPYGVIAEIDCDNKTFAILESGCKE